MSTSIRRFDRSPEVAELREKVECSGNFRDLEENLSLQAMASVASEFLRIQNSSESNGTVRKGSTGLEFGHGKQQGKLRCMLSFGNTLNLSCRSTFRSTSGICDLSEENKVDFTYVNRQAEGLNGKSEGSSHAEIMELFPVSTGFGSNPRVTVTNITVPFAIGLTDPNSRSVLAKADEQPSTAQLIIFYNGETNVYDDMSDEKAQAIMKLASTNSSNNSRQSTISSRKIEQIAQQKPSKPALNAVNENQSQGPPLDLEIVRKLSLKRFLEKRKERFNSVAPYATMKRANLPSKAEKDSDEQIILSLGYPGQQF